MTTRRRLSIGLVALLGIGIGVALGQGRGDEKAAAQGVADLAAFSELKWEKLLPALGDASPERAIARVDAKTGATQLFLRTPKKIHIRRHWHTANEATVIVKGAWTFTCDRCGKNVRQGGSDFGYIPAKCIHQVWVDAGSLIYVTSDGPFDLNWVEGESTKADLQLEAPEASKG